MQNKSNIINKQLESVIKDVNTLQTARNKAFRLQAKLDVSFASLVEIKHIFEEKDLAFLEVYQQILLL